MTTKTISTYVAGYTLSSAFSELLVTATGTIGGTGLATPAFATLSNYGRVGVHTYDSGIRMFKGGVVNNARRGLIDGTTFVTGGSGAVTNFGRIVSTSANVGVDNFVIVLQGGGGVTNGSGGATSALIQGYNGIETYLGGTVTNFGVIDATGYKSADRGVRLRDGGHLTNGAVGSHDALIEGYGGVDIVGVAGTVTNFGTIEARGVTAQSGIDLDAGGVVRNGSATDGYADIRGDIGVKFSAAGSLINYGTISGSGIGGARFYDGCYVVNGGPTRQSALIEGNLAIEVFSGAGTVRNFGTIQGFGNNTAAVYLEAGGTVTNGGATDRSALIQGGRGVVILGAGTVANSGTIVSLGSFAAGALLQSGSLTNGSVNNGAALIEGFNGVYFTGVTGAGAVSNFGTIWGQGDGGGNGVILGDGSRLTNGSAGHAGATIVGYSGVSVKANGTVTNFGTIIGEGGVAVKFDKSNDVLIVEAGSTFVGAVRGGGGTLVLDTGAGTLTGLLAGGSVTVSKSMAATTFDNFATVEIGAAASFTSSGAVTLVAGQAVIDDGSLTLGTAKIAVTNGGLIEADGAGVLTIKGAVKNTGTLSVAGGILIVQGAVTGAGAGTIAGGTLDLASTFTENVTFTGPTGILELAQSQGYAGTITGFSKAGETSLDLDDIAFSKATTATYSGTKSGGVLTVTDGAHTAQIHLTGDYRTSTFVAAADGHGGTLVHDPSGFVAAMAGFGAGGVGPVETRALWAHAPPMLLAPRTHIA